MSDSGEEHLHESLVPKLVASTGEDYNYPSSSWEEDVLDTSKGDTAAWKRGLSTARRAPIECGLFKSVHLYARYPPPILLSVNTIACVQKLIESRSGDGTTLVSSNEDNKIRTFILYVLYSICLSGFTLLRSLISQL